MKLEACIENSDEARLAANFKLDRVELCQALDLGGLTPTPALVTACAKHIEVHAMLRLRPGNFVYSESEIEIMISELEMLQKAGAKGVVFGCLNEAGELDIPANSILAVTALDLNLMLTFHRAFDGISLKAKALENLIKLGFSRILTSGGSAKAVDNVQALQELATLANHRIEIMAGCGVNSENATTLEKTGVDALHFSIRKSNGIAEVPGMGAQYVPNTDKIEAILKALEK